MAKSLSILYVTSEIYPYAKINPLADVAYSLPLAVRELGHDIRVMLPKYGTVSERKNRIHEINRLKDMPILIGGSTDLATVKSSSIANPRVKVQAYIATNVSYLDMKKGIYADFKTGKEFANNDERFIFFNKTVIETCLLLGWFPDIIHINNWHTAMIAAFARILFPHKFKKTKMMLTIHDFQNQGVFPEASFEKSGLPESEKEHFMHNGKFNFLKAAIHYSDAINTVSPTYSKQILQDSDYSGGLNQVLLQRSDKITGITHGLDNWAWNPKNDNEISYKYSGDFPNYKKQNKTDLLKILSMLDDSDNPVISIITNFDEQSGMKMFAETVEKLVKENVKIIVMGEGDFEKKAQLKKLARKFPGKFVIKIGYDEPLSHKMIAGSDFVLLPSLYEPSGLNAIFGLAYGTIPIARNTGASVDLLNEYNAETGDGNSFLFSDYNADALISSIIQAVKVYNDKPLWHKLCQKTIAGDYSWDESAKRYDEIYRGLMRD